MGAGTSTFVIRWINFISLILGLGVVGFGVWMSTHHDECARSLTIPVMGLGSAIFIISLVGFIGAWKNIQVLLWTYLIMLFLVLVGILAFTVFAFIITNSGSGHDVAGLRFKEYHLQNYHAWFVKEVDNADNWNRLKSCLVKSKSCSALQSKYKALKGYELADLTPVESGCCRPPSDCRYPLVNASIYDLNYHPPGGIKDCNVYRNEVSIRCYDSDSCKAAVAQYMRTEWRVVAFFNVILFVVLSIVYLVGCCAGRNAAQCRTSKVGGR